MTIDQDIIAALIADVNIAAKVGTRVHYQRVPQGYIDDYIWLARSGSSDDEDRAMDDASGASYHFREFFDVECISQDLDDAVSLALLVKKFDSKRDTLGNGTVQAIFVRDHADDYVARGVSGDDGSFVGALQFELVGYAE